MKIIKQRMSRWTIFLILMLFTCFNESKGATNLVYSPPKIIIDTDLDSDVDDVGALAMLLNLHKAGDIDLIGVIVTSDDPYAPICAAALNTFYGFPEIPVGFLKDQPVLNNHSRYTKDIANRFPSNMKSWKDAEEAVQLYRELLSGNSNKSVIIVTIGHLSSLQRLLQSEPDRVSPLKGNKLVKKKVIKWICMGGQFPEGKEANFYRPDPQSTNYCIENWKKEVIFCGWEAGNQVITGGEWLKDQLEPDHPVYCAYELYNNFKGRQSWDQLAVLQLIKPTQHFFSFIRGYCVIHPDGSNNWINDKSGKHRYILISPSTEAITIGNYIDSLMAGGQGGL